MDLTLIGLPPTLLWIIGASILVSLISLIGILTLSIKEKMMNKILFLLVALSAGAMLGGAALNLIPEGMSQMDGKVFGMIFLLSFSMFFLMERVLKWHHCHEGHCHVHTFAYMNLVGDAVHNFTDGVVLAAAFLTDISLGITTTFAIILHEIPQEMSDFGVLVYAGFKKGKALFYNFISALTALLGAVLTYWASAAVQGIVPYLIPVAAGSFVYIACSDLIPELHKESDMKKALAAFAMFLVGIMLIWVLASVVSE